MTAPETTSTDSAADTYRDGGHPDGTQPGTGRHQPPPGPGSGLSYDEHVKAIVWSAPRLTTDQIEHLRRLLGLSRRRSHSRHSAEPDQKPSTEQD